MTISPDGKYLFTSTAGDDSVAMFSIDQEEGTLTKEFALPISGGVSEGYCIVPGRKASGGCES